MPPRSSQQPKESETGGEEVPTSAGLHLHSMRQRITEGSIVKNADPAPFHPLNMPLEQKTTVPIEHVRDAQQAPHPEDASNTTPAPQDTDTAHSFFDTVEWRAHNESIQKELGRMPGQSAATPSEVRSPEREVSTLQPIRTYQADVANTIQARRTSVVETVAAEQNRVAKRLKEREEKVNAERNSTLPHDIGSYIKIALSGVLIGLAVATIVYVYVTISNQETQTIEEKLPSYVFSEDQIRIDVTSFGRRELMNALITERDSSTVRPGAIVSLYLTQTIPLPEEGRQEVRILSAREFFERLEVPPPDPLLRAFDPLMLIGFHASETNQPFFIFRTSFFENAFAGMLQWETRINSDLAPLFGPALSKPPESRSVATGTVSSGTPGATALSPSGFRDGVVRNKEVRTLRDAQDGPVLVWGFTDQNTLVITTSEQTYAEIIARLASRRF